MDNLGELIQLYGLDNLPDNIRKERELKRWRDIMAQQRYEQDDLPNFLDAEAEARESSIDRDTFIRRKQALAQRWFGYYRKCKSKRNTIIDQYNKIALMKGKER